MAKQPPEHPHPSSRGPAPSEEDMVRMAKRVTEATDCPVVGGVAVILHKGGRSTYDIDIYSQDFWAAHEKLEAAGMLWNPAKREHSVEGYPIHMVGENSLGGPPKHVSVIRGVKVIGLADLIRGKLTVGLEAVRRSKDLAHVIDLIERNNLGKDFAAKLPKNLRAPFKELVDQTATIHEPRRTPVRVLSGDAFRKKYSR